MAYLCGKLNALWVSHESRPQFHEKTSRERKNEMCGGRDKKREILGLPTFRVRTLRAPTLSGYLFFSVLAFFEFLNVSIFHFVQEWETTQNGCKCAVHNG